MLDPQYWIVVKLKPNQDKIALLNLKRQNYEFFHPKLKLMERKNNKFVSITKPAFPGYLFISIDPKKSDLNKINHTTGIAKIITFGNKIPLVDPGLMQEIKARFSQNYDTSSSHKLKIGMEVEITNGPLSKFVGQIEEIHDEQRVWVLLNLLGSATRISIDKLSLKINN